MMSKDPSTKVGAVLVRDRRIISTGYNGFPKGITDDGRLNDRSLKYQMVVHAEMNALLHSSDTIGSTLYMYGFGSAPCGNCTKHLIAAGVRNVVSLGKLVPPRWAQEISVATEMLDEAGVGLECWNEACVDNWCP